MTLAVTEERGGYGPEGVRLEAKRRGDEYVLSGRKLFVPDAHVADYAIVAARTSEGTDAREGITLLLTPLKTEGVVVTPHATMALEKQAQVDFNEVRVSADSTLGAVDGGWPALERALQRAATAKGLEMVGGAEAVLDMTLDYLKDRVQFGRPVGTFPGVAAPLRQHGHRPGGEPVRGVPGGIPDFGGAAGPSGGFGGQGVGERRLYAGVRHGGPVPRRGGIHGGAQPAAIHPAGAGARAVVRGRRVSPAPAVRRG